jgi:protein-S-isoprenylcysteine O-methyltransferase Ste14
MNNYLRIFGSGPLGVILTAGLTSLALWWEGHYPSGTLGLSLPVRYGVLLVAAIGTLAGIIWSFRSLPVSQRGRGLCTQGAYRWVRHPLYASFISLGAPGVAIFLNHWIGFLYIPALHLLWHGVIGFEEKNMVAHFGDEYLAYAKCTGRFVPRLNLLFRKRGINELV